MQLLLKKINVGAFYATSVDKLAEHDVTKTEHDVIIGQQPPTTITRVVGHNLEKATNDEIAAGNAQKYSAWGVNAEVEVADGLKLAGEYVWNRTDLGEEGNPHRTFKSFGLTYGELDTDKVGSFEVAARYYDKDRNSYFGGSGANYADYLGNPYGVKFWEVSADVAVMPAMDLKAFYVFNVNMKDHSGHLYDIKADNVFGLELNYAF